MAHLGQSTEITTVKSEEIVLTGADGQTFKMKVADLAEAVRKVMPVATLKMNGLMSPTDRNKLRDINVTQDTSKAINLGSINGLIRFRIWSFTNEMSVYLISGIEPAAVYVAGRDISSFGYSFSFNSSKELILVDGVNGRVTHISGMAESTV